MKGALGTIVEQYPWAIALVFFAVSVLINSQGAVVVSMLPLAYSLGIPGPVLLGLLPSVYGYFFIPNYPSDIATTISSGYLWTRRSSSQRNRWTNLLRLLTISTSTLSAMDFAPISRQSCSLGQSVSLKSPIRWKKSNRVAPATVRLSSMPELTKKVTWLPTVNKSRSEVTTGMWLFVGSVTTKRRITHSM